MNNLIEHINTLKNEALIADMALGFEPEIEISSKWEVLDRYFNSGVNYVGLAVAGEFTSLETAIRYIARQRAYIESKPEKYIFVKNSETILRAKREKKLALGFWMQGSMPLANDIHMIELYYRLGIRYMLLAYNNRNAIGNGVIEKHDAGLSAFGYKVIAEMNRVGMLIDLSHAGIKTSLDTIAASESPVIFSHSNAYGVTPHIRNLTDEQIIAVAKKQGVIGINGLALFLGVEKSSSKKIVDHMDYMMDLVGDADFISLGLDLVYFHEVLDLFFQKAGVATYPQGYVQSMDSFQPESIAELIEEMLRRGHNDTIIKKILGDNFLRVTKQVWKEIK